MTDTIHVDQFLAHSPAKVWRMLTEPDRLAQWWAASGEFCPEVGHRFTIDMGAWGMQRCTVTEVEEERLLSYTFAEGEMDWTITWRLAAEGSGTRLFLEHGGFDLDDPRHQNAFTNMSRGWPGIMPRLARALEEVPA